jgi:hypothetical protein
LNRKRFNGVKISRGTQETEDSIYQKIGMLEWWNNGKSKIFQLMNPYHENTKKGKHGKEIEGVKIVKPERALSRKHPG